MSAKKALSNDLGRKLGNTALYFGKSAATKIPVDLLEGKPFKVIAQNQINDAKIVIAATVKGSGRKRKRKNLANLVKKHFIV